MHLVLQTQDLDLSRCGQIRRDSWQVLQTSNWWNLKKADFAWRLSEEKGVGGSTYIVLHVLIPDVQNSYFSKDVSWRYLFVKRNPPKERMQQSNYVSTTFARVNAFNIMLPSLLGHIRVVEVLLWQHEGC